MFSNNFPEILDYQDFDARMNIRKYLTEPSSTGVNFSTKTLLTELKPVFVVKYEISTKVTKNVKKIGSRKNPNLMQKTC